MNESLYKENYMLTIEWWHLICVLFYTKGWNVVIDNLNEFENLDQKIESFNESDNPSTKNVIEATINIDIPTTEIEPSNLVNDIPTYFNPKEVSEDINEYGNKYVIEDVSEDVNKEVDKDLYDYVNKYVNEEVSQYVIENFNEEVNRDVNEHVSE